MTTLFDITESLIESVYFHEKGATDLERNLPPRQRREPPAPERT